MTILEFDKHLNNREWTRDLCERMQDVYLGKEEEDIVYRFVFLSLPLELNGKIEEEVRYKPWNELSKMGNCPKLCEVLWEWLLDNVGDAIVYEKKSNVTACKYTPIYVVVDNGTMRLFWSWMDTVCHLRFIRDCHTVCLKEAEKNANVVATIRCKSIAEEKYGGYILLNYRVSDDEAQNKNLLEIRKDGVTLRRMETSEIIYYLQSGNFGVKKE